jgi:hypothetical protein
VSRIWTSLHNIGAADRGIHIDVIRVWGLFGREVKAIFMPRGGGSPPPSLYTLKKVGTRYALLQESCQVYFMCIVQHVHMYSYTSLVCLSPYINDRYCVSFFFNATIYNH